MRKAYLVILLALFVETIFTQDVTAEDVQKHFEEQERIHNFHLKYLSYEEIIDTFYELEKEYPYYIKVYDAAEQFNNSTLPQTRCFQRGSEIRACKYVYAVLTNFSDPRHTNFTQSFFSGNFHGDEAVGPNILTYTARYILEKPLLHLLSKSYIVILPMSNPSGYYLNTRDECQFTANNPQGSCYDLNRDFPYDINSGKCFRTAGARIINNLWKQHLFSAAITFHGGMFAISWPWGSYNHAVGNRGQYSPDQNAFFPLGKRMSEIADSSSEIQRYPYDTLTNSIYPASGTFDDWSYAASWEKEISPNTFPQCENISQEEMFINANCARSLTYLIETTDPKKPNEILNGKWSEIQNPSKGIGHVSRNVRLTLDFINNISPSYDLIARQNRNFTFFVKWAVEGCQNVTYTQLLYKEKNENEESPLKNYLSLTDLLADGFIVYKEFKRYQGKLGPQFQEQSALIQFETQKNRTIDIALISECDPHLIQPMTTAIPTLPPQTHFVRSRQFENYTVENNGFFVNSNKYVITVNGPYLINNQTDIAPFFQESSEQEKDYEYIYVLLGILVVGSLISYFIYKKFSTLGQNSINFQELHDEDHHHSQGSSQRTSSSNRPTNLEMKSRGQDDERA